MPSLTDFKEKLADFQRQVEQGLDRLLPAPTTRPARLHEAMRYSLEAGGKRLRPTLVLAVGDLFGARVEALPAAVAIECVHTYSLIHDDLPAMDNDDLRRGRPTCHRRFDEATAILAGDALLTHAFALVAQSYAGTPALAVSLLKEIGAAAGSEKLIGGQMADIEAEGRETTTNDLDFIHAGKTAALLTASVVCGGMVGEAGKACIHNLRTLGHHLGLAFQVVDDILDVTATSAQLGKTAGKDAESRKATMISVHGIDGAIARAKDHTSAAAAACAKLPGDTRFLSSLIAALEHRMN